MSNAHRFLTHRRPSGDGRLAPLVVPRERRTAGRCRRSRAIVCDFAGVKSAPIVEAAARPSVWLACRRVWRNVARQSKTGLTGAPIVMIPALDVESILRTWTPLIASDIPLKGAQARESSAQSAESAAFAGLSGGRSEEPSLHACGPLA